MKFLTFPSLLLVCIGLTSCNRPMTNVKDSCVRILNCTKDGDNNCRIVGSGSGFIVNENGNVMTNNHVTAGSDMLFLLHQIQGSIRLYSAKIVKADGDRDLAVLKSSVKGPALILNLFEPQSRANVSSCGYPAVSDSNNIFRDPTLKMIIQTKHNDPDLETKGVDITEAMKADVRVANFAEPSEYGGQVSNGNKKMPFQLLDEKGEPMFKTTPAMEDGKLLVNKEGQILVQKSMVQGRPINIIEHDVKIGHGNSGGPLMDHLNYLVGVVGDGQTLGEDSAIFAISGARELKPFLEDVGVAIKTVNIAPSVQFGLTSSQIALLALALAAGITSIVFGVILLAKKQKSPGNMPTEIFNKRIKQFMEGSGQPGGNPTVQPAAAPVGLAWELDISGPNGFRQQLTLTDADFLKGRGRVVVGRNADFCCLPLRHDSVSRQQMHFSHNNGTLTVADRNSSNGTKVGGVRLATPFKEQALREGDRIEFGELTATLRRRF